MTPAEFIRKWSDSQLRERQASQEHFIDLCRLLGQPTPAEDDSTGDRYCFERGAEKIGGGDGWADVWRKGCFGWEYKGKHKDLGAALRQLQAYALDLQNPPYLVVSDMERIIVHTNWTNTVSRKIEFTLDDLHESENLAILKLIFEGSDTLKPGISPQELTAKVAQRFGTLGRRLQERGHHPRDVAHFLNRIVFCMFAEDARLLPDGLFTRLCRAAEKRPAVEAAGQFAALFTMMRTGGMFGADIIRWFNGGLFDDKPALPLERDDIKLIGDTAAEHDWSQIDPAIFGNLFEEALKTTRERPALGAHYTDREKILKIVEPVIIRPLTSEWEDHYRQIKEAMEEVAKTEVERKAVLDAAGEAMRIDPIGAKAGEAARRKKLTAIAKARDASYGRATDTLDAFMARLAAYRVLDPACGSGNFLYVALHALKDLERRALVDAERLGLAVPAPRVGLQVVRGIEIEEYAAELARVTLWIGDLQWNAKNNYTGLAEPILSSLDQIECRDALLNADGTEAEWPAVDVIIGNPPFLGGKLMRANLGTPYVDVLWQVYDARVPHFGDFVSYWFGKAWDEVRHEKVKRVGLVATNSVRGGASREVLDRIVADGKIFDAWADEPWTQEGAAVRVSMICFSAEADSSRLNGQVVDRINPDLTSSESDLTKASRLSENIRTCFEGGQKFGPFDVPGDLAREWLKLPSNPHGRLNAEVLRPLLNAADLVRRGSDAWIIDFEAEKDEAAAALYEAPFQYVARHVKPVREKSSDERNKQYWWRHHRSRPELRQAQQGLNRYIVTPVLSKYRLFSWLPTSVWPSNLLDAVMRDDDVTFGVLHSRYHELWSLRLGTSLEDRPRYTPSTTFETFPFPEGLTPNIPAPDYADDPHAIAIAEAAKRLNELRENWLNPSDLVVRVPEVVPGYPDRILPKDDAAAAVLKKRTLTNLYNQRPAWLDNAHRDLDAAVAAAYGWPTDLSDEELLERLFALNQERAAAGR